MCVAVFVVLGFLWLPWIWVVVWAFRPREGVAGDHDGASIRHNLLVGQRVGEVAGAFVCEVSYPPSDGRCAPVAYRLFIM